MNFVWAGYMSDLIHQNLSAAQRQKCRDRLYDMARSGDVPQISKGKLHEFLMRFDTLLTEMRDT